MKKIAQIEAHVFKEVSCYFIEDNKAVSCSDDLQELFFWDVNDMKNWKKLFSIENMEYNLINDSNDKLKGFVIDNKVRLLPEVLFE